MTFWDMYLRIAARDLLGFIPRPVAAYRYHGGNSVLNRNVRAAQFGSLIRTSWKNYRAFHGFLRFGLLYKHFKLKKQISAEQGNIVAGMLCRIIYKPLYWLSIRRYNRIIGHLDR
jgi:hypothetical protein